MSNHRQFLKSIPVVTVMGAVMSTSDLALAALMVAGTDPQAKALGYVTDTTKANKAKFPKYMPDQYCNNCTLYQGGAVAQDDCPLLASKNVTNRGWCSTWTKKA